MDTEKTNNTKSVSVHAVVVAGGSSSRMLGVDKMLVSVRGRPLLFYSIQALNECDRVDTIAIVVSRRIKDDVRRLIRENGWGKVTQVIEGGVRRQDSVRKGLSSIGQATWVIVHDGARPCVGSGIFERGIDAAQETGSSVAAVPVTDTIKLADENMKVTRTLARERVWAVQTPQVFRADLLQEAHRKVSEYITDDASMVEVIGGKVKIFDGSYSNIKVTTPVDLIIAEAFLEIGSEELEDLTLRPDQG